MQGLLVLLVPLGLAGFALGMERYQAWLGRPTPRTPEDVARERRRRDTRIRLGRKPLGND